MDSRWSRSPSKFISWQHILFFSDGSSRQLPQDHHSRFQRRQRVNWVLSVIRTILTAVAPIWLTRKSHISIRYPIIYAVDSLSPPPPPPFVSIWLWIGELFLLVLSLLQLVWPCQFQHKVCIVSAKKKKGQIENYKCSTFFNQLQPVNHCSHNDLSVAK